MECIVCTCCCVEMHRRVNACGAQSTTVAVFFNLSSWFPKHGCHSTWSSLILLGWLASESLRVHEFPPISDGNIDMCHRVLCSFLIWVLMTELGSSCLQSEHCTDWAISPAQYDQTSSTHAFGGALEKHTLARTEDESLWMKTAFLYLVLILLFLPPAVGSQVLTDSVALGDLASGPLGWRGKPFTDC